MYVIVYIHIYIYTHTHICLAYATHACDSYRFISAVMWYDASCLHIVVAKSLWIYYVRDEECSKDVMFHSFQDEQSIYWKINIAKEHNIYPLLNWHRPCQIGVGGLVLTNKRWFSGSMWIYYTVCFATKTWHRDPTCTWFAQCPREIWPMGLSENKTVPFEGSMCLQCDICLMMCGDSTIDWVNSMAIQFSYSTLICLMMCLLNS